MGAPHKDEGKHKGKYKPPTVHFDSEGQSSRVGRGSSKQRDQTDKVGTHGTTTANKAHAEAASCSGTTAPTSTNNPIPAQGNASTASVNGFNPALGANQLLTHTTQPAFPNYPYLSAGYPQVYQPDPSFLFTTAAGNLVSGTVFALDQHPTFTVAPHNPNNRGSMADYQNTGPVNLGHNYQPQVPDTTYGPISHVYRPRFDNQSVGAPALVQCQPVMPVSYIQQPLVPAYHLQQTVLQQPVQHPAPVVYEQPVVIPPPPPFQQKLRCGSSQPRAYVPHTVSNPLIYGTFQGIAIPAPVANPIGLASTVPIIAQQPFPAAPMMMAAGGAAMPVPIQGQPMMAMGGACAPGQPVMFPPGAAMAMPGMAMPPGMMVQGNPGGPGGIYPEPACGIGRTHSEYTAEQMEMAYQNNSFEPQDFKPADDDPSRMYMCRELDGNWTLRNRFSIDRMASEWRWHMAPEGYFYAVRLPN